MAKWYVEIPSTAYRRKHPRARARISQKLLGPSKQYGHAFGPYSTKKRAVEVARYQGW